MGYQAHPGIARAVDALRAGGVVAYPTEAVWGLGADPFHRHAVARILQLKRRPQHKGVILVAADAAQFDFLLHDLPAAWRQTLAASWPGPFTWLVPHRERVPPWVCGAHSTVALRVSAHPVVQALCRSFGGPLVSTSANPQGRQPARHGYRARLYFGDRVTYAPGQVGARARPSEIRDLATGRLVRE